MTTGAKIIEIEGLPVSYLEAGEANGRALLLLSGGVGDAQANWAQVLPALAQEYHVFAPDLPGFGQSAPLPDMTVANLIQWLRALLDGLKLEDAVIVGSFFGALLARLLAAAAPQYVPALVLINGGGIPRLPRYFVPLSRLPLIGKSFFAAFGRVASTQNSPDQSVFVREVLTEELIAAWHAGQPAFIGLIRAFLLAPLPAERTPPVPTLLLWGVEDKLMPRDSVERLKLEIPGAQLEPIAECGSLPQLEAPDAVAFQISAFLDRLRRPSRQVLPGAGPLRPNST